MNIKDVLNQIGQDVLTEDTKKLLSDAFEESVKVQVDEKLQLEKGAALRVLDEEHSQKLEQLLEAIDKDHTAKLHAVLEKIDTDHLQKLQYLIERHNKEIKEDANEFKGQLVEQLSNYLDVYISKSLPKEELSEAVKNKQAQKILSNIKELVALDEEYINKTITEAVSDGKTTIDTLKSELHETIKNNIQINQELKAVKSSLLLEKSTVQFSKDKKDYVMRILKDKDPDYITENIDYVVKMFEKDDDEKAQLLTETAKTSSKTVKGHVDTPKSQIAPRRPINESTDAVDTSVVNSYIDVMKGQDKYKI